MIIEMVTSLTFLVTSIYGPASTDSVLQNEIKEVNWSKQEATVTGPKTLEAYVKDYFKDDPILADIARCESQYRQFKSNGHVIRGIKNSYDVGVMQINEKYHADTALKFGFDIYSLDGNMDYAKWLYDKEGVQPWMSSSKCWSDKVAMN